MKIKLFAHSDFDGMASAALVLAYLRDNDEIDPDTVAVELVDYSEEMRWRTKVIVPDDSLPIIVDFLYHPSAFMYWDHHQSSFLTAAYRADFDGRTLGHSRWDPTYQSCCHLVFDQFRPTWFEQLRYRDLVTAADKIDGAKYDSPGEYFDGLTPEILLNHAWQDLSEPEKVATIRHLAKHGLLATSRTVTATAQRVRERNQTALYQYTDRLTMIGDVACVDLVGSQLPFLRYAPYYLRADVRHTLTLHTLDNHEIALSLGRNPWGTFTSTAQDLGVMAQRHGGGGHAYAASCTFPVNGSDYGIARQVQLQLARELTS